MSYRVTKRHRSGFSACHQVKEASLERLCNVRFQPYKILEKAELGSQAGWLPRASGKEGGRDSWASEIVLCDPAMDTCHYALVEIVKLCAFVSNGIASAAVTSAPR